MAIVGEVHHQEGNVTIQEAPIYGDVLEGILSHVPLVDLVPASLVCKSWSRAVKSSLDNFSKPKPWLVVHSQSARAPYSASMHAYDPRSHVWVEISQPSVECTSALRSSNSSLLYMISPTKLSFSHDPLNLTWQHVEAPQVWRRDPIVAMVNNETLVIAGGACDFEEDPLSVEVYDMRLSKWHTCESMPASLKDSSASTWLSAIVANDNLVVMEKSSGSTHIFNPKHRKWSESLHLRPDPRISHSVLGSSDSRSILVGLIGTVERIEAVKIYELSFADDEEDVRCEEIGEMPLELAEKLRNEVIGISNLNVCLAGDLVYLYNAEAAEEVVAGEMVPDGVWRWWSIKNSATSDRSRIMERTVYTCAQVGVEELGRVMTRENRRFKVKEMTS